MLTSLLKLTVRKIPVRAFDSTNAIVGLGSPCAIITLLQGYTAFMEPK